MTHNRMDIAYADHRDDRMIILGRYGWPTLADQDRAFDELPAVEDSDFIIDYYDEGGCLTKDKYVSQEVVEEITGRPIAEMIRRGRIREAALSRSLRRQLDKRRAEREAA